MVESRMITRRVLTSFFLSLFFVTLLHAGNKKQEGTGSMEGTFYGVEQGDYTHLQMRDKQGKQHSFIVLRPDKSVESYLANPAKLKGRSIRVFWKEEMIPEAGEK